MHQHRIGPRGARLRTNTKNVVPESGEKLGDIGCLEGTSTADVAGFSTLGSSLIHPQVAPRGEGRSRETNQRGERFSCWCAGQVSWRREHGFLPTRFLFLEFAFLYRIPVLSELTTELEFKMVINHSQITTVTIILSFMLSWRSENRSRRMNADLRCNRANAYCARHKRK